jgi:cyanate lyase
VQGQSNIEMTGFPIEQAVIHEKVHSTILPVMRTLIRLALCSQFGDGIMSMIDCKINVDKKPDPKGDRVVLTFE